MRLDGGFLKDICGGLELSTSMKNEHQVRFEATFRVVIISNNDKPLDISPLAGTRDKRKGWFMNNRFVDANDPRIDNVKFFPMEASVRERICDDYRSSMLRLLHELYMLVQKDGFDEEDTPHKMEVPDGDDEARGIEYWVDLYEVYNPPRGAAGMGMMEIYNELKELKGYNELSEKDFYRSNFKSLMVKNIEAFRKANNIEGRGGPRHKCGSGSSKAQFFGIRLRSE